MMGYLDRLNLRPFEKRLVVIVAAALFVVVNLWLVIPHFGDLSKVQGRMSDAQRKLKKFTDEIAQAPKVERIVDQMEAEGHAVPREDQSLHFSSAIESQASASGVTIIQRGGARTLTNQYFLEQSLTIQTMSGEKQLVDFLYRLGEGNSLIRVRDLSLKPDPGTRQSLQGSITLVASYQKTAKPAAPAATPAAKPAPKPAAPPAAAKPAPAPAPAQTKPSSGQPATKTAPASKPPPSTQPSKQGAATQSPNTKAPKP
jgi:hypothetical protein